MDLIDADFSPDLAKDKQREKKKNGSSNGNSCFENNGNNGSVGENRPESKKEITEKAPDVKEEPEESEINETMSTHNSPLDEKSSPAQQTEKEVSSIISNPNSCKGVKSENGENTEANFRNDSCESVLPISLPSEAIHEGVQPLPSNVVNKQPVTMEAQYMQQQSQIFVFSTALANKAAEAVLQGQYASIISYHCAQPRTKKYLEGTNQQNQMMQNSCGSNMNVDQNSGKTPMSTHSNLMGSHTNSLLNDAMMPLGDLNQDMGMTPPQPLAGVKVPDENLTPQQRQHREEQLATLRKMQQILFPEALPGPDDAQPGGPHVEENSISENLDMNKAPSSQTEWHKLQMQFYEDQKTRKTRTNGPPPSYQQATRSASVPIALQSPNPSSPNNTTSNLSLPSPRTCSGINSPADKVSRVPGPSPTMESPNPVRNTNSNPPTPVSSHLSPKHKDKLSTSNEFSPSSTVSAQNSQQSPADSMYCRPVQGMGQQKQVSNNPKEPNLMPVPSPQQIQYLNTFEGQELTIQKQPNTSLKDAASRKSPGSPSQTSRSLTSQLSPQSGTSASSEQPVSTVRRFGYESEESQEDECPQKKGKTIDEHVTTHLGTNQMLQQSALEGVLPNNNASKPTELPTKLSGSPAPSTPDVNRNFSSDINTGETPPDKSNNQPSRQLDVAFCNSPQTNERCHMSMQTNYMQKCPNFVDNNAPKCGNSNEKDLNSGNFQCIGPDNVPLNPNRINTTTANKPSHFDPISSLAQMSQQLTNNVPNSPVNQQSMMQNMHQNMPPFNSPNSNQHLMMGEMHHIPNTAAPDHRMQPQMQPHFNTSRPQCNSAVSPGMSVSPKMMQAYGPPQRPIPRGINYNGASIQVKPNAPNTIQYLPSRPQAASVPRGPPSLEFLQRFSNPLSNLDSKLPSHNLQYFPNNYPQNNMNDMGMCSSHGNIRGPIRPTGAGMMRLQSPQMGFNNPETFQNSNCQLFAASSKNPSLGLAPDASQPLPPSMGQNNNFKNSTFIGPTTADPNYAQQFHNFQQQLYATNTRGQLNSQNMSANQHYFIPK